MNIGFDLTVTVGTIVAVAVAIIGWVRTRNTALDDRLNRHENRITIAEKSIAEMPGNAELHKIELGIAEMRGDLKGLAASMDGNAKIMARLEVVVSRQEDHLLKGSGR